MDNTKEFTCKGYWWLPSTPEDKVAGVLTYTPDGKITLELIGAFKSTNIMDSMCREYCDNTPIIYGIDSNAKEITLLKCYQTFSYNFSCDFPIIKYDARYMVYDKHINGLDEVCQYKAFVKFPELSYWARPHIITRTALTDDDNISAYTFKIKIPDEDQNCICKVECENGTILSIKEQASFHTVDIINVGIE